MIEKRPPGGTQELESLNQIFPNLSLKKIIERQEEGSRGKLERQNDWGNNTNPTGVGKEDLEL